MGTANTCDKDLLQPGAPCIIMVDEVNSPTGIWWGKVVEVEVCNGYLSIRAEITGGRFRLMWDDWQAIKSTENSGRVPSVNYLVYPDTKTTRELFNRLRLAEQTLCLVRNQLNWLTAQLETAKHIRHRDLANPDQPAPSDSDTVVKEGVELLPIR